MDLYNKKLQHGSEEKLNTGCQYMYTYDLAPFFAMVM